LHAGTQVKTSGNASSIDAAKLAPSHSVRTRKSPAVGLPAQIGHWSDALGQAQMQGRGVL